MKFACISSNLIQDAQKSMTDVKARRLIFESETHASLDAKLLKYAHLKGYLGAHFRPGMTSRSYTNKKGEVKQIWVTAISGDGKYWPDWVFFKGQRKIAIEVKTEKDKASPGQLEWLAILREAGFRTIVGRPSNWDAVEELFEG